MTSYFEIRLLLTILPNYYDSDGYIAIYCQIFNRAFTGKNGQNHVQYDNLLVNFAYFGAFIEKKLCDKWYCKIVEKSLMYDIL